MESINFVAIDFETATAKAACQIGIAVVRGGKIVEEVSRYIQPPDNKYSKRNIAVHHITAEMTANSPTFGELWPEIRKYFDCQLIVCHNSSFDMSILEKEMDRYNIPVFKPLSIVCTYELIGMKLEEACAFYDISLDNHHDALSDAVACAKLFIEYLTSDKEIPCLFEIYEETEKENIRETEAPITFHTSIRKDLLQPDLENADPNSPFYDKKVVITGLFPIDRNTLAEKVKSMGADINTTISKKTQIVLMGDEAGPKKIEKIAELQEAGYDIKVYNVDETMDLINN